MKLKPPKGERVFNFDKTAIPDFSSSVPPTLPERPRTTIDDGRTMKDAIQDIESGRVRGSIDESYYHLMHG